MAEFNILNIFQCPGSRQPILTMCPCIVFNYGSGASVDFIFPQKLGSRSLVYVADISDFLLTSLNLVGRACQQTGRHAARVDVLVANLSTELPHTSPSTVLLSGVSVACGQLLSLIHI